MEDRHFNIIVYALSFLCLVLAYYWRDIDISYVSPRLADIYDRIGYEWFIEDCSALEEGLISSNVGELSGKVHIVYAANPKQFRSLFSSILSLSRSFAKSSECVIHVIVPALDVETVSRLVECLQVELDDVEAVLEFEIHELLPIALNLSSFKETWRKVWPAGAPLLTNLTFAQLYLPKYLQVPRALWLNPDTIIRSDVSQLFRQPMKAAVAAALDSKFVSWRSEYTQGLDQLDPTLLDGIPDIDARTLNNGVLLVDLERWVKDNITGKLEAWVERAKGLNAVELALNFEFVDRFDVLNWRWNLMGLNLIPPQHCMSGARILNFAGNADPWDVQSSNARMQRFYRELMSPFTPATQCYWGDATSMLDSDTV